jgi:integrase
MGKRMPRKVRDAQLETRTARSRLKVRHKPYYRLIEQGLHLGYRKLGSGPGTWVARRYIGVGNYRTENLRTIDGAIVLADDFDEADGKRILNFAQAQQMARGARAIRSGPLTVSDILDDYLRFLDGDGRSTYALTTTRHRINALIRPQLGKISVSALTPERLRHWRDEIAKSPARVRTAKGVDQRFRKDDFKDDDVSRARRASTNRVWTILRAALNHAFRDGKVESDAAWRKVKPFKGVGSARIRYLSIAESKRLINACDPEFRPLVQAALLTGARYSELARLRAKDFNLDAGTIFIEKSKSGKARHVVLTNEGVLLFQDLTAGQSGESLILTRSNGQAWGMSNQLERMGRAVKRAKIAPPIGFHGLRHTYASLSVMNGMPLQVLAGNLGHANTKMCEEHYAHLAQSFVAKTIRETAPRFGYRSDAKVATIR